MKNTQTFCEAYTQFYGEPINSAAQLKEIVLDGNELRDFAEFYAKHKFSESGLRHFYIFSKLTYVAVGGLIATVIFAIAIYFIL